MAGDKGAETPKLTQRQIDIANQRDDSYKKVSPLGENSSDDIDEQFLFEKQSIDPNAFSKKRGPSSAFTAAIGRARESVARSLRRNKDQSQNKETQSTQSEE